MIHLPKKRPWLLLVGVYTVIILVWVSVFMLAKHNGEQRLKPEEVEDVLKSRTKLKPTTSPENNAQ